MYGLWPYLGHSERDRTTDRTACSEAVTGQISGLPVTCVTCKLLATLFYGPNGLYRLQRWDCPHCTHRNEIMMAGRLVSVEKRHAAS